MNAVKAETKTIQVPDPIFSNYIVVKNGEAKKVVLLLHGYAESAEYFYKKLEPILPKDTHFVIPNGPFFIPVLAGGQYRAGHSWYFYNMETDEYIVDMNLSVNYVSKILHDENLHNLPLTVIGYSQGGYLSPFVGFKMPGTVKVVGINCQFLEEEMPKKPHFELVNIHGEEDEVVDFKNSKKSMEKLLEKGVRGQFHLIPGHTHRINSEFLKIIQKLI